ncbi:MAG: LysR substrate-binding domain-containing protein [Polyangiaceae bacterium]
MPRLLVEDVETLGLLVKQGLGCAILPKTFAGSLSLREVVASEVGAEDLGAIPSRELWMLVHRSKKKIPRVRAVMTWIEEVFALRKASS